MADSLNAIQMIASLGGVLNVKDATQLGPQILTIDRVAPTEIGQDKEEKTVVFFRETRKTVVVNKLRAEQLASLAPPDGDLVGLKVLLYVGMADINGKSMVLIQFADPADIDTIKSV